MIYRAMILRCLIVCILLGLIVGLRAYVCAQSQAIDGQIEGMVTDQKRSAVAHATVTAQHTETGTTRRFITDESGIYRFPIVSLGTYRITVEAPNFKRLVHDGIKVAVGQAATLNVQLEPGELEETVTVSGDVSVADGGKIELGRVINDRDVQNLPVIARNPYLFGRLQTNVNGRWNRGFGGFSLFNANGFLRRVNYQIDGNANTIGGSGSSRFSIISDTSVSEVQLITNGFAPEFGNTTGMIMNIITPSGSNRSSGNASYRFRLPSFYSRPFYFSADRLPESRGNDFTGNVGGPLVKDRAFYYVGYEYIDRQNNASADRLLTIKPQDRDRLIGAGLSPAIFPAAVPSSDRGSFYVVRSDIQLDQHDRAAFRLNINDSKSPNFSAVRLNSLERMADAFNRDLALGSQLASYTSRVLNEFRFQYSQRRSSSTVRNATSGLGPSITITGVAGLGSPLGEETSFPTHRIIQFQNNFTRSTGEHVMKFGGGSQVYLGTNRSSIASTYTFASIDAYLAARSGANPFGYDRYDASFGEPNTSYRASFWNMFAQDDWKISRRLKLNYGLRYDLYVAPKADRASPLPTSRHFAIDKNNFAPRVGSVYTLREGNRPTIIRLAAGIYYDAPLLQMYRRARENNGNGRFIIVSFVPGVTPNAPAFPASISGSPPPGTPSPPSDIDLIAPDFRTMYAVHANLQVEQSLSDDLSIAVGYVHSAGRRMPVYRSTNCIPTGHTLADGRPIFATTPTGICTARLIPQFNIIQMVEAVGRSQYDALNVQLTQRHWRGLQIGAFYTLSRAVDDAPEQNLPNAPTMQGYALSDPTDRSRDEGYSLADQRHTFIMSLVARPRFGFGSRSMRYIANNNQIGLIANANSGERFNIISTRDLNRDGVATSDRPVGIRRNSGVTPPQYNVDLRYSRFFAVTERYLLEFFGEFQNLFNVNRIIAYNNIVVNTNTLGELISPIPDFRSRNQSVSQESRQLQLGVKFLF